MRGLFFAWRKLMPRISAAQAGGTNVLAFLDLIAWSEGTDNGRQPTRDQGYDVVVGGSLFDSYADHPRRLIDLPAATRSCRATGTTTGKVSVCLEVSRRRTKTASRCT
jgi:muramidase (phage lysozyme)